MKRRHNFIEFLVVFVAIFSIVLWNDARQIPPPPILEHVLAASEAPSRPAALLFAGDMMLGRQVGKLIAAGGAMYPFEKIASDIAVLNPDVFIANLEGPITRLDAPDTRVSAEQPFSMRFHFDPSVADILKNVGFTHLSVANNHAFDQGREGANDTLAYLKSVDIAPIGFRDGSVLGTVSRENINGHDVALVALDTTVTWHDRAKLGDELRAFSDIAFVVVFMHWGNEYEEVHSSAQADFAHFLIDNGVDLIIGAHPHVVQDVGTYGGKRIYYSLGNFVFDQYWNDAVQTGLMVKVTLDDEVTYEELTIKSEASQPFLF